MPNVPNYALVRLVVSIQALRTATPVHFNQLQLQSHVRQRTPRALQSTGIHWHPLAVHRASVAVVVV
jgi:hypothetical protein